MIQQYYYKEKFDFGHSLGQKGEEGIATMNYLAIWVLSIFFLSLLSPLAYSRMKMLLMRLTRRTGGQKQILRSDERVCWCIYQQDRKKRYAASIIPHPNSRGRSTNLELDENGGGIFHFKLSDSNLPALRFSSITTLGAKIFASRIFRYWFYTDVVPLPKFCLRWWSVSGVTARPPREF